MPNARHVRALKSLASIEIYCGALCVFARTLNGAKLLCVRICKRGACLKRRYQVKCPNYFQPLRGRTYERNSGTRCVTDSAIDLRKWTVGRLQWCFACDFFKPMNFDQNVKYCIWKGKNPQNMQRKLTKPPEMTLPNRINAD
jgi:hypothetical protein